MDVPREHEISEWESQPHSYVLPVWRLQPDRLVVLLSARLPGEGDHTTFADDRPGCNPIYRQTIHRSPGRVPPIDCRDFFCRSRDGRRGRHGGALPVAHISSPVHMG